MNKMLLFFYLLLVLSVTSGMSQQGWWTLGPDIPGMRNVEHVAIAWEAPDYYRAVATISANPEGSGGVAFWQPDTGWRLRYQNWQSNHASKTYLFSDIAPWDTDFVYIGWASVQGSGGPSGVSRREWYSGGVSGEKIIGGLQSQISMVFLQQSDSIELLSIGRYFFRSTDRGLTWQGATSPNLASGNQFLVASNTDESSFVYGSGPTDSGYTLYRSGDYGTSWDSLITVPLLLGLPYPWSLYDRSSSFSVYSSGDTILLGVRSKWGDTVGDRGMYRSTDDGSTWTKVYSGYRVGGLAASRVTPQLIFASTEEGILESTDLGLTWACFNCNLPTNQLRNIVVNPHWDELFVATETHSILVVDRAVTDVASAKGLPESFTLSQNYPNPFNPSTEIQYGVPHRSHVIITLTDVLGRAVRTLYDGEQAPGYHTIQFDGSMTSSGIYYCRMQAENTVQIRKLLLIR